MAVLTELRIGIEAAHQATISIGAKQQIASSDASLAHRNALSLVSQTPVAMADPVVQEQFKHLQALLRRIHY
jgi:hypothetical protein